MPPKMQTHVTMKAVGAHTSMTITDEKRKCSLASCGSRPARNRCGRCHHVYYCSAACQQSDWITPEGGHKFACYAPCPVDALGEMCVMAIVTLNNSQALHLIQQPGFNPNYIEKTARFTLVMLAAQCDLPDVLQALIAKGADPKLAASFNADSPLALAAGGRGVNWSEAQAGPGAVRCVKILLAAGALPNYVSRSRTTALYLAASKGYHAIVQLLIDAGANVNFICASQDLVSGGVNCLFFPARDGFLRTVQVLLAAGVDPDVARNDGIRPIELASQNGHVEVVQALIAAGVTRNLERALHQGAAEGRGDVIRALLAAGADPEWVNTGESKLTALQTAAFWGFKDAAAALLEGGAALDSVTCQTAPVGANKSPIDLALSTLLSTSLGVAIPPNYNAAFNSERVPHDLEGTLEVLYAAADRTSAAQSKPRVVIVD